MHAVNAHPAGSSMGPWCLAHANGVAHRTRLGEAGVPGLVAGAFAQLVQVRYRQAGQALVAGIAVHAVGVFEQVHDGRTTHVLIGAVHFHE